MKKPFSRDRITTVAATLAVCGVAYAAVTPLGLPWQEMAQKTDHHERVLAGVGHYEGTMSLYMPESTEPVQAPCSEVVTGIGELWTTAHFQTNLFGMPFEGSATLGYDVAKGKYVGTWIDNMITHIIPMEGEFDEAKQAIVMHYESLEPGSTEPKQMRSETVHTKAGYVCKFFELDGEDERLQMEIAMTRKSQVKEAGAAR